MSAWFSDSRLKRGLFVGVLGTVWVGARASKSGRHEEGNFRSSDLIFSML